MKKRNVMKGNSIPIVVKVYKNNEEESLEGKNVGLYLVQKPYDTHKINAQVSGNTVKFNFGRSYQRFPGMKTLMITIECAEYKVSMVAEQVLNLVDFQHAQMVDSITDISPLEVEFNIISDGSEGGDEEYVVLDKSKLDFVKLA